MSYVLKFLGELRQETALHYHFSTPLIEKY